MCNLLIIFNLLNEKQLNINIKIFNHGKIRKLETKCCQHHSVIGSCVCGSHQEETFWPISREKLAGLDWTPENLSSLLESLGVSDESKTDRKFCFTGKR